MITDLGFRVRAAFVQFEGAKPLQLKEPQALVEGTGRGAMQIRGLTREAVKRAGLKRGDWVVVNELEWPPVMQGRHLGRIVTIGPRADAPLFAQIVVEPPQNLMNLREVLVVTRGVEGDEQ